MGILQQLFHGQGQGGLPQPSPIPPQIVAAAMTNKPASGSRYLPPGQSPPPVQSTGPIADIVHKAAKQFGIDPGAFTEAAKIESNLGTARDNPKSQYRGLFQVGTEEAKNWGIKNVLDPADNAIGTAKAWATQLKPELDKALGRPAKWGEVYLAHQQGVAGAAHMLLNPDKPAVSGPVTLDAVKGNIPDTIKNFDPAKITGQQFANIYLSRFAN